MEKKQYMKIAIVDHVDHGIPLSAVFHSAMKNKGPEVIVIDVNHDFEINGIKYKKIEQPSRPSTKRNISKILAMDSMLTLTNPYYETKSFIPRKRPKINIKEEFTRIQNKESTLSRNDRDWVETQFFKLYKLI